MTPFMSEEAFISKVEDFITRRLPVHNNWQDKNQYWFASILVQRFPVLTLWYFPEEEKVFAGTFDATLFFDWLGRKKRDELKGSPISWYHLNEINPNLYGKLVKEWME